MLIQPVIVRRFSTALAVTLLFPAAPLTSPPVDTPSRVQTNIVQIRAENAAIRGELRKLEDRQRVLLLVVQMLRQVCDGASVPVAAGATNHADAARIL